MAEASGLGGSLKRVVDGAEYEREACAEMMLMLGKGSSASGMIDDRSSERFA